jgi:hypothetical protein
MCRKQVKAGYNFRDVPSYLEAVLDTQMDGLSAFCVSIPVSPTGSFWRAGTAPWALCLSSAQDTFVECNGIACVLGCEVQTVSATKYRWVIWREFSPPSSPFPQGWLEPGTDSLVLANSFQG